MIACITVALSCSSALADTLGGDQLAATGRTVALQPGADPLPPVKAASWVLADATTGEILAHKGAHVQRPPASTLKMLTALTVLPRVPADAEYVATARAAGTYGSRVGLKVGRAYTLDQLWYAVFLPSANDAAIAVAEANGGVRRTVRQMNDVAQELRALDTVARNTSGLDAPGQVSSAYDLALMARAGLKREDFAHYAGTARARFPDVKGRGSHRIYTTNRLLLHGWKGVIGVKTGFTSKAGRTYVGAARRGGRTLIVTLMGITESSEQAARELLAWGFANADRVLPVGVLVEPGSPLPGEGSGSTAADASPGQVAASGNGTVTSASVGGSVSWGTDQARPSSLPLALSALGAIAVLVLAGRVMTSRRRTPGSDASGP